jgi:acetolactate synthase-1/2/3 large subunit
MPDPGALERAAAALAGAERPLIVAQRGAGDAASFAAFARLAEDWAIPVCSYWAVELAIATDHPCHVGPDPVPWIAGADVILVLDSLAPWMPDAHRPREDAVIVNMGPNPIFSRFPVRNFRSDITLTGENADTIPALAAAMARCPRDEGRIAARRARVAAAADGVRAAMRDRAGQGAGAPMSKEWISRCVGEALEGRTSTVFTELGTMLGYLARREHRSFFQEPHSGGLGWSFPAALGAALAEPDRLAVATMGDGSYMFANPTVCHQVAEALDLPVIVVVLNNGEYGAVRHSVLGLYPDGHAAKTNEMPLTGLRPSPDFTLTAAASRAHVERVERGEDLPGALERAIRAATEERRQVLLDVATAP